MRRFLAGLLAALMVLSLCACGAADAPGKTDGQTAAVSWDELVFDRTMPLRYAERFSVEYAGDSYKRITINNDRVYLLVAEGAEKFAHKEGFERKNMLTDRAKAHYRKRLKEMSDQAALQEASGKLKPYSGHDTVGMACLDMSGKMTAATSTSGLFMKKKGRVGDSPISGSGFYADSKKGAASATGLGEDLMKGCISYEIVRLMGEGTHPQKACETAVARLDAELKERRGEAGGLSLIAMNPKGEWGVATNIEGFSFAVVTEALEPTVYLVTRQEDGLCTYEKASDEWMENYMKTRMAPIEE